MRLRLALAANAAGARRHLGGRFQQVSGLVQFPNRTVANTNSYTQIQIRKSFFLYKSVRKLKFVVANALCTAGNDIAMPDVTVRLGLFDPETSTYYPVRFNGNAAITLVSGQVATTDEVSVPLFAGATRTAGKKLFLIKYLVYASAPANFPGASLIMTGADYNEWGNSLTDKTGSGSFTAAVPAGTWDLFPAIAIVGDVASRHAVVNILGDSISSDGASDTQLDYYAGWASHALADAGIPYINTGVSSQTLLSWRNSFANRRAMHIANMIAAGVTHVFCPLGTNDIGVGQTGAQLYANQVSTRDLLAPYGIKLIPTTLQPRTNAANNAVPAGETNTFTERAAYNALVIANNGVGDGYFGLAAISEGSANLWRTDLNKPSGIAVNAGGSGYTANDLIYLPYGNRVRVSTVSGGAITALTVRRAGGFASAPSNPVAQLESLKAAIAGGAGGVGATFDLTNTGAGSDTGDGIHPGPAVHSFWQHNFAAAAPALFAI